MSDPVMESLEILGTPEFSKFCKSRRGQRWGGKRGTKGNEREEGEDPSCFWHHPTSQDNYQTPPDMTRHHQKGPEMHHLYLFWLWGLKWARIRCQTSTFGNFPHISKPLLDDLTNSALCKQMAHRCGQESPSNKLCLSADRKWQHDKEGTQKLKAMNDEVWM